MGLPLLRPFLHRYLTFGRMIDLEIYLGLARNKVCPTSAAAVYVTGQARGIRVVPRCHKLLLSRDPACERVTYRLARVKVVPRSPHVQKHRLRRVYMISHSVY